MKAILVLEEMPQSCIDCRLMADGWCYATRDRGLFSEIDKRPCWCPLKEMPKKRGKMFLTERSQNDTDLMVKSAFANCYTDGWNDCLEEIEK